MKVKTSVKSGTGMRIDGTAEPQLSGWNRERWRPAPLSVHKRRVPPVESMPTGHGTTRRQISARQLLGHGGMGAVYRATHLGTKRTVAVKVIHPQLSTHDQFVARFRREAEAAGRLRHPNVVDVTDFGIAWTGGRRVVKRYKRSV